MKRFRAFLPLLVLIAIGVVLLSSGVLDRLRPETLAREQANLHAQIALHPLLASLAQIAAMTLAIATGLPGMIVLVLAGGMLFGIVAGTFLTMIGVTIGALILFLASRHAFGDHSQADAPGLVTRVRGGYLAHPLSYTFFLRLVPFFPFGGVTVALAWLRCPLWLFVTATAIGGTLMTGVETALGAALARNIGEQQAINSSLLHDPAVLLPLAGLGLLALIPVLVNKLRGGASN
ncbi:MAG: TVP38/TMEM64 family protein [Rudaea sp.]